MKIKLENTITGETLEFGRNKEAYALNELDLGTVAGQHNTTKYINLNGSHINATSFSERDISITGWVFASNLADMRSKKNRLNHFFNPRHDVNIYYEEYVLTIRPDASVKYAMDKYENTKTLCKWMIQGTAFSPLWKLKKSKVYHEARSKGTPLFPLIVPKNKGISFGYTPGESVNKILNIGDAEPGFVVRFKATEGQVSNPKITNNKTEKYIEVIADMELGDVIEVSTVSGSKYAKFIRGESEMDILKAVTKKSSMNLSLSVGINDLSIDAAENAVNLATSISFSPEWLEVQG